MFEKNSRFASLIEEKPKNNKKTEQNDIKPVLNVVEESKKSNFFKNGPLPKNNFYNRNSDIEFYQQVRKAEDERKKLEEERKKEEEKKIALDIESFPSLGCTSSKPVLDNKMSFISKLGDEKEIENEKYKKNYTKEEKLIPIRSGWTEITINKKTNKISMNSNVKNNIDKPEQIDSCYNIFSHLVYLHEKRTGEYIENWGFNEWTHTFEFPNYDYHYFDKLDEIYEENNEYEYEDSEEEEDQYWRRY